MENILEKKPLVSILMAVYRPNEKWLKEQLISLNNQDYENLELIIWDDCPDSPVNESLISTGITNFSYTLIRGESNLGSNGAFEELTKRANGDYICYCDQDDVWNDNKISIMLEKLIDTKAALVCCDQYIIDENSVKTADSIVEIRKRHTWRTGSGLAKYLIADNFVTGCALIIPTEIAKKAIPFETLFVHDHWIGIVASLEGSIEVIREPLIGYRQHSNNQTGILVGVEDKETYYRERIEYFLNRAKVLEQRLGGKSEVKDAIDDYKEWMLARKGYYKKPNKGDYKKLKAGIKYSRVTVLLETLLPIIPNGIFKILIKLAKKGIL